MIVTVTNQKGGVAKTTTAVSLAHGLAIRTKLPVLLIDLDQQGHAATGMCGTSLSAIVAVVNPNRKVQP